MSDKSVRKPRTENPTQCKINAALVHSGPCKCDSLSFHITETDSPVQKGSLRSRELRDKAIRAFNEYKHSPEKHFPSDVVRAIRTIQQLYPSSHDLVTNTKPPFHVVEPSLWFIAKRAWSKFKNYLLNKINN